MIGETGLMTASSMSTGNVEALRIDKNTLSTCCGAITE